MKARKVNIITSKASYRASRCLMALAMAIALGPATTKADIYTVPNKHVIISFDAAMPQYTSVMSNESTVERALQPVIDSIGLGAGDYISLVNFGISNRANDIDELGRTIKDSKGEPISWVPYTTLHEALTKGSWNDMIQRQGVEYTKRNGEGTNFSMLTGSKAFTLMSQRKPDDKLASETYLVMVTDDNYNGCDDINKEFSSMGSTTLSDEEFLQKCQDVARYYNFYYKKDMSNTNIAHNIAVTKYPLKAMVFKVLPSSSMSLSSVVDYPANYGLKRVRGGYQLDFDFKSADPEYSIRKLQLSYTDPDGEIHSAEYIAGKDEAQHITLDVDKSDIKNGKLDVELKGWLVQEDDYYGASMLNPNTPEFKRLNVTSELEVKNDVKALGFIPIFDFTWIPGLSGDAQKVIWSMIWTILLVVLVMYIYRRISKKMSVYTPPNDVITMNVKSSSNK